MPMLILHPATPQERVHSWSGANCNIGRKSTNDLCIDEASVSSYHARIEKRGEEFWLVDLNSTNGTHVNGSPIHEIAMRDGDEILLGDTTKLRFSLKAEAAVPVFEAETVSPMPAGAGPAQPVSPGEALMTMGPGSAMAPRGAQCRGCGTFIPFSVNFCPRCGTGVGQGAALAFPMQQQPVGFVRPMEHPGAASAGMMPLLALLCGLTIVGFPFALIFGLLALAHIRRHGGMESDRKQATWGVTLGFLGGIICAGLVTWYTLHRRDENRRLEAARQHELLGKDIAENEAAVITDLKGIACAQKYAKVARLKDPNKTGQGQYLSMEELKEMRPPFFRRDLAQRPANGYRYSVRDVSGGNFIAVAEPGRYGTDGKRTFSVDATGVVRGQDLNGKSFAQAAAQLPAITDTKNAFDGVDNAVANEVIAQARRLADAGNFDLCRQILDDVPTQFAMTTAAQELNSLKKSVDPFIVEAQAGAKHAKADAAIAAGDWKLGISLFKEIRTMYPTYSKITVVTDSLQNYQTALAQKLDSEAKVLFDKAEAFERDGKPDEALKLYVEIEKNYTDTDCAKRIAEQKPALQKSIREKGAEQLFAQARNLSLSENYRDIVSILEQLMRNYTDTEYVKQNAGPIIALHQKVLAQQYRAQAVDQMAAGRDADALARLEEAVANNADLAPAFRDLFLKLYMRVGQKRMNEGDQRWALALFRKYLALEPEKSEISPESFAKLNFAVAKSEFSQGHYKEAAQNLIAARAIYEKNPEYNDLYGTILVAMGKYEDALPYYDKAIAAKPNTGNYHARRGYTQIVRALYIEQDAMTAFAGLLDQDTAAALPDASPPDTNAPSATAAAAKNTATPSPDRLAPPPMPDAGLNVSTNLFAPTFATILPVTVLGVRPEVQVRYDAAASQSLLDELLDLIDQIQDAGSGSDIDHSTKKVARVTTWTKKRQAANKNASGSNKNASGSNTNNPPDTTTANATGPSATKLRLNRIRTGVELGNAVSAIHQKVLDNNSRKTKAIDALRRMTQLFANGNRDLARAIQLNGDRSAELAEILKATRDHENKVGDGANRIAAYLTIEVNLFNQAYDICEALYRDLRIQHMGTPSDPTVVLDIYFAKLFDRRDFDTGVQRIREAGATKVPLDVYQILPVQPSVVPSAPSVPTIPAAVRSPKAPTAPPTIPPTKPPTTAAVPDSSE